MYNEELKTKFIRNYTQSPATAKHAGVIFNAVEPYEQIWGADLCTKSTEELQPIVDSMVGLRYNSRWMTISILKEYTRWCCAHKVPGAQDGMAGVEVVGIDAVRKRMVASPLHLQKFLDEVFDPESDETIDIIYRCFYWMAYAGIDEEDTFLITVDDVDFTSMSIRYKGMNVPIYREALPAFRNAVGLTSFAYKHPNYSKVIRRDRVSGVTIMRGIKTTALLSTIRSTLSTRVSKAIADGKTEQQLSFYRVWISGLFYRMYERERAGFPVNFSEAATRYMVGKTYKNRTEQAQRNLLARDYLIDYQRWKLAFSI